MVNSAAGQKINQKFRCGRGRIKDGLRNSTPSQRRPDAEPPPGYPNCPGVKPVPRI